MNGPEKIQRFSFLKETPEMNLQLVDYLIIATYFIFVVGIGAYIKRQIRTTNDYLMSGRSIPLWITSLAFISANLGAQEVLGMAASGAKYGIMTAHFYWLGAIPAMLFLGVFMMPFYYGSKARSVPEYLLLRYDGKTRTLNALSFATMTVFSSGVSLYGLAILLESLLKWSFNSSILIAAGIVMAYIFLGGLTSAIYNEVLQFFLIVMGIAPVVYIGLKNLGGWQNFLTSLPPKMIHTWQYMGSAADNPMGVSGGSMVLGLGFVLSFGYWCTDFLVVQRAMVAKNMSDAERTPIMASVAKMILPFVVIFPGLIAIALTQKVGASHLDLPLNAAGKIDYNMTLPTLLAKFFPSGLLGVGLTALIASFMSGMAGNVTAFNSVWTFDIYQPYFKKNASDAHYLMVARLATIVGVLISIGTAYLARSFNNIMDLLQLVFGFVNAPLFATFLLGMFWKRTTANGAFIGLISGTVAAAFVHGSTLAEGQGGWLLSAPLHEYRSSMGQAFAVAIVAWSTCFIVTFLVSLVTKRKADKEMVGLVWSLTDKPRDPLMRWYKRPSVWAGAVLTVVVVLNIIWY